MSFDLDTASFEIQHEPMFPYNLPNFILKNKKRLYKLTHTSIKDLIHYYLKGKRGKDVTQKVGDTIYRLPKF